MIQGNGKRNEETATSVVIRIQRNGGVVYRFLRDDYHGISGCCTGLGMSIEDSELVSDWAATAAVGDEYHAKDTAMSITAVAADEGGGQA